MIRWLSQISQEQESRQSLAPPDHVRNAAARWRSAKATLRAAAFWDAPISPVSLEWALVVGRCPECWEDLVEKRGSRGVRFGVGVQQLSQV